MRFMKIPFPRFQSSGFLGLLFFALAGAEACCKSRSRGGPHLSDEDDLVASALGHGVWEIAAEGEGRMVGLDIDQLPFTFSGCDRRPRNR
jgi:hypothetical protein